MFPSCLCILQNLHLLQLLSGLFTLAASKASAGTSAFCILITDHITVPEWPKQSLIRVMKGWFPAQQSRNAEVIILILCILAGFFFWTTPESNRGDILPVQIIQTSCGPVLNTHATAAFSFVPKWFSLNPEFYWYKNTDKLRFDACALYQVFRKS